MLIESLLLLLQSCFSDHKKASNLEAYVEWFNRLSYLVATEICMVSVQPRFRLEGETVTQLVIFFFFFLAMK